MLRPLSALVPPLLSELQGVLQLAHRGQDQIAHLGVECLCAHTAPCPTLKLIDQPFDLNLERSGHYDELFTLPDRCPKQAVDYPYQPTH